MVVDDHPLLRHGLKQLLEESENLRVKDEATSISQALQLFNLNEYDLVITDLSLSGGNGLDLLKRLRARNPKTRILVCSMHDETMFAHRAISAGAMGYISKDEATLNIVEAVNCVLQGKVWVSDKMSGTLLNKDQNNLFKEDPKDGVGHLTNREFEIFELIGNGTRTSQIAVLLHLSVKTVETHRENIKKKLNLKSGNDLIRRAMHWIMNKE